MAGFSNTTYNNLVNNTIQGYQDRVNAANPYYKYSDKKPTPVTYWNINITKSTLDQGTRQVYDDLSYECPLRFNKIEGFYLYGLSRMLVDIDITEWGPEAAPIEGECLVLPNTIKPYSGDYFTIDYLVGSERKILFRIDKVDFDTLENGANFWKVHYKLDQVSLEKYNILVDYLTVKTFIYNAANVGTNFSPVIEEEDMKALGNLQGILTSIADYYVNLFYKRNVQTFILPYAKYGDLLLFDPYLIEFFIRTKIFNYTSEYLYISQPTFKSSTFAIEYSKTPFKQIEERNPDLSLQSAYVIPVCDPNSLLVERLEDYFEISVLRQNRDNYPYTFFTNELLDRIIRFNLYDEDDRDQPIYKNIIINYVNGKGVSSITDEQLDSINRIEYAPTKELYYDIPLLMYALSGYAGDIQSKNTLSSDTDDDDTEYDGSSSSRSSRCVGSDNCCCCNKEN